MSARTSAPPISALRTLRCSRGSRTRTSSAFSSRVGSFARRMKRAPLRPPWQRHVQALPGAWRPGRQEAPAAWAVDIARGPHILSSSCEAIMQTHAVQQWLEGLKRQSEHEWCATCLDERIRVWEGARIAWWARLDAWLETGVGVGVSVAQMNVDMHAAFGGEIPI
ncbi:hypothetical protein BD310DRAFT_932598 [Dichomitus squalens]|uniref:Uncharacterized protein n=1 Tax=Dichomitus squalens TaxID=114155 RepID=A0A4Q9PNT0_9APHY|nr:hypothetical protein BD310DRAFT_932598 [Dichomitus squalens]